VRSDTSKPTLAVLPLYHSSLERLPAHTPTRAHPSTHYISYSFMQVQVGPPNATVISPPVEDVARIQKIAWGALET